MTVLLLFILALSLVVSPDVSSGAQRAEQSRVMAFTSESGAFYELREGIRCHIEQLEEDAALHFGRDRVAFNGLLADFYRSKEFMPVWKKKRSQVKALLRAIRSSEADGLRPEDYHLAAIEKLYNNKPSDAFLQARYELLLSDAAFKLAYHLLHGRVDPEKIDSNWNISRGSSGEGLADWLLDVLESNSLEQSMDALRPDHPQYIHLKKGLERYRRIVDAGGWNSIPEGPSLKKEGQYDPRIPSLRRRLEITGEIKPFVKVDTSFASSALLYSSDLIEGVKRFQKRHGLEVDGAVGPKTLRALNVSAAERVDQIRVNLDRYRWFIQKLEPTYLLVNIAGFSIQYINNGALAWRSRVIVGEPFWKTPVFKAQMQYVTFNPSWNVPPGILKKEALPAIKKNPGYLAENGLQVIDSNGRSVHPDSVDWASYGSGSLPYRLRQPPGSRNALGRVKFMFPNKHHVYLHDTPGKHLFDKSTRAFSHGCIRLQNPFELASILLGWKDKDIQAVIAKEKTRTVHLPEKIPVFILYLTSVADEETVFFSSDVYKRDKAVLVALEKPYPYKRVESCAF